MWSCIKTQATQQTFPNARCTFSFLTVARYHFKALFYTGSDSSRVVSIEIDTHTRT